MRVMVDTSAWFAVCDRSDRNHEKARQYYENAAGTVRFLTTDAVLVETWALLSAHIGRHAAVAFWSTLRETRMPIVTLTEADIEAAWRIIASYPDQEFSFTDGATFAVMERLRVEEVFTFDRHFSVYRYGPDHKRAFSCRP